MTSREHPEATPADLEGVDAAEAPAIAEALADRLEADLEAVTDPPGGDD